MANFIAVSRTNYFRVTDEKRYQDLFAQLMSEDEIHDFSGIIDGELWHGFGSYDAITFEADDGDYADIDAFLVKLQEILPEGEAFIYVESGYEKLRYVTGYFAVATKDEIRYGNLNNAAVDAAREMLGDPEWKTQLEY